jgi:GTPase SAR1 family protein
MKLLNRRAIKPILLAVIIFAVFTLKDLLTEMVGGKIGDYLQKNYPFITITRLVYCLIAILAVAFLYAIYEAIKPADKEEPNILTENIEPDIKKLFDSLKDRYEKRYQSKLDGRFEITLEVSDDFYSKPRSISEQFGENATKGEAIEIIQKAFEKNGRLLIAGNPGVGKTVLLLKFAINSLDNIKDIEKEPFPVIFNLASWSEEYKNFGDWLSAMLVSGYGFSKAFAETILQQERIIFLLDGLDELARNETEEIAAEKRAKCLAALDDYLKGERKAVICSRIEEFLSMKKQQRQDAPVSAKVRVLNLTKEQVLKALRQAGDDSEFKHHKAANNLLKIIEKEENDNFLEVLGTPFYFTTAMEVFDREILNEKDLPEKADEIKKYLIEKFVERKLKIEANPNNFESEKTRKWLKWLARLMERKQRITFELADLQPADLDKKWHLDLFIGLSFGLFAGLAFGLFIGLLFSLFAGLVFGLFIGLLAVLVMGLAINRFTRFDDYLSTEDIISLDFSNLLDLSYWKLLFSILVIDLFTVLCAGLVVGLFVGLFGGLLFVLVGGGFSGLLVGLFFGLEELKRIESITYLQSPYQRIYGGFFVNLVFAVVVSLALAGFTLSVNYINDNGLLNFTPKLMMMLAIFVPLVLLITTALFLHSILRFCLYLEDKMPLRYATFLNYATELRILEKDGGQWRFRHQNLQVYFAELDN